MPIRIRSCVIRFPARLRRVASRLSAEWISTHPILHSWRQFTRSCRAAPTTHRSRRPRSDVNWRAPVRESRETATERLEAEKEIITGEPSELARARGRRTASNLLIFAYESASDA